MAMSNAQRISFAVDYRVDTTSLQDARKSLQELQKMSLETFNSIGNNRNMANSAEQLTNLKQSALQLEQALARSFNADLGVTNVQRLRQELSHLDLRNIGERFALAGAAGQNAFNSIAGQALNLNNTLKQTGPILTKIQHTFTNALSWNLVTGAFNQITKSISQAWGYSKNLDNSLNSIRIVTRQSAEEMERFAQTAQKTAKGLGQGTVDYTDAALIYYQQGLSDEEVAKKTETTLKTANVTGKSAADVSELLTAVWNGYKVDADEAELYVDKLAAVAATTASDLGELSTAMSKVASVASTTGVDIDQLNAQISTIISVTRQAPESVGTALKTIYSRIGDLKVDGVDEFGVSLGKISSKLKTMGVDILDKNGDMREMGVVFEEVADKWANWTSAQKQAAAVALGGSRQYTNLFALFENWDEYESTLVTSSKAVGTLQEQQDIYAERLTTHLQQLRTAWEGVYDSAFDKETAIKTIDSLTSMVEKLEKFFDTVGGGIPVLKLLSSMLLSTFSTKIATGFTNFIENSLISLRNFTNQQEIAQRQVENMMRNLGVQNQNFSQYQITSLADTSRMFRSRQDVMTEEELNRVNSSMERTIQLENQMNTNAEEVRKTRTFLQGLGMNFDNGMSLQQNLDQQENQQTQQAYGRDFENRRQLFNQIASGRNTAIGQVNTDYSKELGAWGESTAQMRAAAQALGRTTEELQRVYLTQTRTGIQFQGERYNALADFNKKLAQQEAAAPAAGNVGTGERDPDRAQRATQLYNTQSQGYRDLANLKDQEYEILREAARITNNTPDANPRENFFAGRARLRQLRDDRDALIRMYEHGGFDPVTQQMREGRDQLVDRLRPDLVTALQAALQDVTQRATDANTTLHTARQNRIAARQSGDQAAIQQANQDYRDAWNARNTARQQRQSAEALYNSANANRMDDFRSELASSRQQGRQQAPEVENAIRQFRQVEQQTDQAVTRIRATYGGMMQEQRQTNADLITRMRELRTEYNTVSSSIATQTQATTRQTVATRTLSQALTEQRQGYQDLGGSVTGSTDQFTQNSEAIQAELSSMDALGNKIKQHRNTFSQMYSLGLISDADLNRLQDQYDQILNSTTGELTQEFDQVENNIRYLGQVENEVLQQTGLSYEQAEQTITQAREQQLASARAELQQITTQQQELMRTLNMRQVIQTTTQLATGMTSLASSATMFKNAWTNIMSNDDLSTWGKMVQLLGSVGPMLIGMAPQIKNLGSIIAKGAVAIADAGEAGRAAAMSIQARTAAIDRSNLTEQQRAIAQAKHINLTGQEITMQEAEIIATEEQIAAQKRYAEVSALSMNAFLIVISAAVTALAWGISKMKDAEKELEESRKKFSETVEEITKRNKELRETVESNVETFEKWEGLWESFKKGKVAVDDVKTSMENLIEQLGLSDDLEFQRLLRIAEYTQDYSELEKKLDDIIGKQKQVASGTYDENAKNNFDVIRTGLELDDIKPGKKTSQSVSNLQNLEDAKAGTEALKRFSESGGGIFEFTEREGDEDGSFTQIALKDLSDETIQYLYDNLDELKAIVEAYPGLYFGMIDDLIGSLEKSAGTYQVAKQNILQKTITDVLSNTDFSLPEGTEKEQLIDIEKQVQSTIQAIKDAYGKEIEDKDLEDIELQVRNKFLKAIPDSKEILDKTDVLMNDVKTKINIGSETLKLAGSIDPDTGWFVSNEDVAQISEQLTGIGKDALKDINWDSVISDTKLFPKILTEMKEKGELSDETLQAIAEHLTEAAQAARELTADFDALGATWDDVNKKLEKNSLTDRNLRSNKEFQSLIDDDTIEQIRTLYGATPDVGKAIDIIINEDISSSSQRWREAWEVYGEAIKNADIEQSLQNINEEMDKLSPKKGEIQVQADAYDYYEVMDDILAEDYDIDVNIHGRIDAELENIKSDLDDSVKLVTKIGEGFTLSANELNDFADEMPEILDEMQVLSDGSIQLSQTAVEAAKKAAIEKANEEIDGEIQVIKAQRAVVEHKKETVEEMLKIAQSMANGEYNSDVRLKEAQEELNAKALDLEDDAKLQAAIAEGALQKEQLEKLSKYYEAGLSQTQDYVLQRNEMLATYANFKEKDHFEVESFAKDLGLDLYSKSGYWYMDAEGRHNSVLDNTAIENQKKLGEHLLEILNAQKDEYQSIIDSYNTDIKVLEAYKKNYQATWDAAGKATDKSTDAKEKNADATDKQSAAEAKLIDLLEEEIDAYHDINILIKELDTNLSRLQKQQSKLYGKDLIDNLKQQGELLDQQIGNYEEKIRLSQMELAVIKQRLQAEGVQFNEDGTVSNYSAAMQKKIDYIRDLQIQYNAMSAEDQENFKDTLDKAEKAYDKFKEDMEKYDQLLTEDIPELEDQIQDAIDSQIELKISAFETEVQLKLDTTEAEKNMREFRRKVIDQIKEDDILGNAIADYQDISYYRNDNGAGIIQVYTKALEEINQAVNEIEAGGISAIYGDNLAAAQEAQKEMQENLRNALMEERDLVDQIQEAYLSMIDKAQEKFDEQIESYNKLSSLINHDMNVIKLLYGEDKAYAMLEKYYQKQNEYNAQQMDMYMKQAEYWKQEMENAEKGSEAWKKFKENYENAVESSKRSLETSIQGVIDTYVNAIDKIFLELEEKITGGLGMDRLKKDWDFLNNESDKYLDTINGAYEIQKLEQQMKEKIAETDDLATQRQLTDVMNEQLETLRERDKITQYDVDRANALFDIEVKKAAFRDAQQNKSKMRLRRDSQGNYSYQFVSDEDQVAQAARELADAQNSLYNLDKDAYKNNLDQIQAIWVEWAEELATIENDSTLEHEEKERRREELALKYNEAILNLTHQNEQIRLNLMDSTFQSLANMYNTDVEYYQNMSDAEKNILMEQMVPAWGSAMQQMATLIGQEGLMGIMQEAFDEMDEASADFDNQLAAIADRAGGYFDFIKSGEDLIVEGMERMMDTNDAVLNQWEEMVETMKQLAASALTLADGLTQISQDAVDALKNLRDLDDYQAEQEIEDAANNAEDKANDAMGNNDDNANNNGLDYNRDDWGDGEFPQIGDKVTYLGDPYYYDSYGTNPSGTRGAGQNKTVTVTHLAKKNAYPVHVQSSDAAYGWLKKYQIAKMDTGGYTGDWNSKEGRLGILHEKELVLNKFDSQAFLDLVDRFKMWFKLNDIRQHWEQNLQEAMLESEVLESMRRMRQAYDSSLDNIQPIVNITAEFPDATDAQEIQTAFENLVNHATQIARSKLR